MPQTIKIEQCRDNEATKWLLSVGNSLTIQEICTNPYKTIIFFHNAQVQVYRNDYMLPSVATYVYAVALFKYHWLPPCMYAVTSDPLTCWGGVPRRHRPA